MAVHELNGNLRIWWFPKQFCQSRFGEYQRSGTNSCTLISLILADKIAKEERSVRFSLTDAPRRVFDLFGAAINEGNGVYNRIICSLKATTGRQNLNIPDALRVLKKQRSMNFQLQEWFFTHLNADPNSGQYSRNVATRLTQILTTSVELFQQQHDSPELADQPSSSSSTQVPINTRFLFVAVIANSRTVIFVMEFPIMKISFFDSHQHGESGAIIAQCSFRDMFDLMQWFVDMLEEVYYSRPALYEIAFLTIESQQLPPTPKKDQLKMPKKLSTKGPDTKSLRSTK